MDRDKLDFKNGEIKRLFSAMFFPTLIGMASNSVLNICDGMFVGHGVGSNALAAINIVAPLFLICTGIGLMFGIGASVIGGIRLAEGNVNHNDTSLHSGCHHIRECNSRFSPVHGSGPLSYGVQPCP